MLVERQARATGVEHCPRVRPHHRGIDAQQLRLPVDLLAERLAKELMLRRWEGDTTVLGAICAGGRREPLPPTPAAAGARLKPPRRDPGERRLPCSVRTKDSADRSAVHIQRR